MSHKQEDYSKVNTVESINILSTEPIEGKVIWIVDDMIDTGGSIESLILALAKQNPAEMNVVVVHAPFYGPAAGGLWRSPKKPFKAHHCYRYNIFPAIHTQRLSKLADRAVRGTVGPGNKQYSIGPIDDRHS